jgi:DNA-binding winged helix-turn-helix (wHTH) protein/tetratricopeptide (TPR) repeat protein
MQSPEMSNGNSGPESFVVGDWTVTPSRNLLVRGDESIRVEPRVMDALVHLAERPHQLVSKEALIERVWQGRYVTDDVVTVTIYALRKALGDDARRPRYIETVSRRGYRWLVPVQSTAPTSIAVHSDAPDKFARVVSPPASRYSVPMVAAIVALVCFVAGVTWMLTTTRQRRHVPSVEAHEAYVKGRYFLDQRSIRGWKQALEQFERAVALDPNDPAAQAGLADTYTAMSDFGVASPAELRPRAMQAAHRALELDARSAEGLAAVGRAQLLFDWDFAAAERNLSRALTLNPDYMPAYQGMAWLKSARGQYAEAIEAAQRALQLDPVNTARYTELAWVLALGGRHAEAMREIERALQLNPRAFELYLMKGWASELTGQPDAAYAAYSESLQIGGAPKELRQLLEDAYRTNGLPGYYRVLLDRPATGATPMSDTWRAQLYVRVGELDRAIESLEHAYQRREGALAWVRVEPSFQVLRSDQRFQRIAARVGGQN